MDTIWTVRASLLALALAGACTTEPARACELRGFDVDEVFPDVPMLDCNTGVPYHGRVDHPGARGRCGMLAALRAAELGGSAVSSFNGYLDAGATDAGATDAPPPPPGKGPRAEVQLGAPRFVGGDYPAKSLSSRLDPLNARFSSCAGAATEADGAAYSFDVQFKIDRFGVPAFFDYFQRSGAAQASVRRVMACVGSLLKGVTYAPPSSGKGVAVLVLFSVNPRAAETRTTH